MVETITVNATVLHFDGEHIVEHENDAKRLELRKDHKVYTMRYGTHGISIRPFYVSSIMNGNARIVDKFKVSVCLPDEMESDQLVDGIKPVVISDADYEAYSKVRKANNIINDLATELAINNTRVSAKTKLKSIRDTLKRLEEDDLLQLLEQE